MTMFLQLSLEKLKLDGGNSFAVWMFVQGALNYII